MIKKAGQSALLLAVYKQKIYQSAKFCSNIKKNTSLEIFMNIVSEFSTFVNMFLQKMFICCRFKIDVLQKETKKK